MCMCMLASEARAHLKDIGSPILTGTLQPRQLKPHIKAEGEASIAATAPTAAVAVGSRPKGMNRA
jgi:hypothetical protein